MRYQDNWETVKKRFSAFWAREVLDRCCVSVTAPAGSQPPCGFDLPEEKAARRDFWLNPETIIARERKNMEQTYYAGDAFPHIWLNLGACGHAGFFKGAKYQFEDTVWFFPSAEDPDELEFDENSFLYQKTLELARAFVEDSQGDYIVSMPDDSGNADALAHLLGSNEVLPLMLEEPELFLAGCTKLQAAYEKIMTDIWNIVRDNNDGGSCIGWLDTWAPGLHAQMQCDLSVMISNTLYHNLIMPELRTQANFLEYPLYHFDGAEQIRHLDDLLSIPDLKAIQWMQCDGQPPCTAFIPELQKIQAAGKNLVILVQPAQIECIMENLSSRGLLLVTKADSRHEADQIVEDVTRWTHD